MSNKQTFNMIPDPILTLILGYMTFRELFQNMTVCKRFKSIKKIFVTLSLPNNCLDHISYILNNIENTHINHIIVDDIVKMRNKHLNQLEHLQNIETLICIDKDNKDDEAGISDVGLKIIGNNFRKLKKLTLEGVFTRQGYDWSDLLKLHHIESLSLIWCGINSNIFANMNAQMRNIRILHLVGFGQCVGDNWYSVATLQNIEDLDISNCYIKNVEFAYITNELRKIVRLNIAYCDTSLTEDCFINIVNMQKLKELILTISIDKTYTKYNFSNNCMKCLENNSTQLKKLNIINGSKLTSDGLLHATNIVGLQELTIDFYSGETITDNTLMRMAEINVNRIIYRSTT